MREISIINAGLGDLIGGQAIEAIGALLLLAIGLITKKYIVPLLKTSLAKQTAGHVLLIADDVTDYFAEKFPGAHWSVWLDKAVDRIIDITGVGRDVAGRAARASVARKDTPKTEN